MAPAANRAVIHLSAQAMALLPPHVNRDTVTPLSPYCLEEDDQHFQDRKPLFNRSQGKRSTISYHIIASSAAAIQQKCPSLAQYKEKGEGRKDKYGAQNGEGDRGTCSSKCSSGYHDIMEAYDKRKWTGLCKTLSERLHGICLSSSRQPGENLQCKEERKMAENHVKFSA